MQIESPSSSSLVVNKKIAHKHQVTKQFIQNSYRLMSSLHFSFLIVNILHTLDKYCVGDMNPHRYGTSTYSGGVGK